MDRLKFFCGKEVKVKSSGVAYLRIGCEMLKIPVGILWVWQDACFDVTNPL